VKSKRWQTTAPWITALTLVVPVNAAFLMLGVWAVPYFGPNFSHAPGDILVILGLACLLLWRERLSRLATLVPFCAVYGAGAVYLEFLTGQLPTAMGLLFPMALPGGQGTAGAGRPARGSMALRTRGAGGVCARRRSHSRDQTDPGGGDCGPGGLEFIPRIPAALRQCMAAGQLRSCCMLLVRSPG
jgi:hypothetical protein